MITIENATVETLDMNQARPVGMGGRTQLSVTIGIAYQRWLGFGIGLACQYILHRCGALNGLAYGIYQRWN